MRKRSTSLFASLLCSAALLSACGNSGSSTPPVSLPEPPPVVDPAPLAFKAASARRVVSPTPAQLAGYTAGTAPDTFLQQFNLGGYGSVGVPDSLPALLHFDIGGEPASGNFEPVHVRALVLEGPGPDGVLQRVAFVTLDATGAGNVIQRRLKAAVSEATGIAPENVLFGQTHTHSGPDLQGLWGGVPEGWRDCSEANAAIACDPAEQRGLYQLAAAAVKEAVDGLRPAQLKVARLELLGEERHNNYRRCNPDGALISDPRLMVLQALDAQGAALGTMVQYAAHPTVLGGGNRMVHSDFVGAALRGVEARYGATALYFNGPIADASPRAPSREGGYADDYAEADALGAALAASVQRALQTASRTLQAPLRVAHAMPFLAATNPLFTAAGLIRAFNGYYEFASSPQSLLPIPDALRLGLPQVVVGATTQVSRITLGEGAEALEIVTIPGEAARNYGESIRARAATEDMMLLGLTHDSLGYIIPVEEFGDSPQDCGAPYEETVSLGPLTVPLLDAQAYGPLFGQALPAP